MNKLTFDPICIRQLHFTCRCERLLRRKPLEQEDCFAAAYIHRDPAWLRRDNNIRPAVARR
jgi:hypothetical protein